MGDTKKAGKKGGSQTLKRHGKKHFSKIAKDAWTRRKEILAKFKIGDLENPITKASVVEALENADDKYGK